MAYGICQSQALLKTDFPHIVEDGVPSVRAQPVKIPDSPGGLKSVMRYASAALNEFGLIQDDEDGDAGMAQE